MSDLLVYVVIAVVAIAGAAAWLYFPKRVRGADTTAPAHSLSRHKENPARIAPGGAC